MKKNPFKTIGIVFSCIAGTELVLLLFLLIALRDESIAKMVLLLVFSIQILVFGGIGVGFLLYLRKKRLLRERLIADGYREMADVVSVEPQTNVQVNGRCSYRVICRIARDGVLHEYRSELLGFHPALPIGSRVPVYFDRYDDCVYCVDVEGAMPTVVRH